MFDRTKGLFEIVYKNTENNDIKTEINMLRSALNKIVAASDFQIKNEVHDQIEIAIDLAFNIGKQRSKEQTYLDKVFND